MIVRADMITKKWLELLSKKSCKLLNEKICISSQKSLITKLKIVKKHADSQSLISDVNILIYILSTGLYQSIFQKKKEIKMVLSNCQCIKSGSKWYLLLRKVWLEVSVSRTLTSNCFGICSVMPRSHQLSTRLSFTHFANNHNL